MRKFEYDKKLKKDLNIYERAIYNELYSYSNPNKGVYDVYPNIVTIASELGINKNTVIKYLKTLATKGYLNIFKKKLQAGNKNVYSLNVIWSNLKEKIKENSFIAKMKSKANKPENMKANPSTKEVVSNMDNLDNLNKALNNPNNHNSYNSYALNNENKNSYDTYKKFDNESNEINNPHNSCKNSDTTALEYNKILEADPDIKDKIAMVKAVTNPYHEIKMPLIRNLSKLPYQEVFNALDNVFEKIKEDGNKVSIKYVENTIKTSLRWNKFLK